MSRRPALRGVSFKYKVITEFNPSGWKVVAQAIRAETPLLSGRFIKENRMIQSKTVMVNDGPNFTLLQASFLTVVTANEFHHPFEVTFFADIAEKKLSFDLVIIGLRIHQDGGNLHLSCCSRLDLGVIGAPPDVERKYVFELRNYDARKRSGFLEIPVAYHELKACPSLKWCS